MKLMAQLLNANRPAADIMAILAQQEAQKSAQPAGRNDACPCGSGKKFKKCWGVTFLCGDQAACLDSQ